jgi:NMD protein affecting ribosome stability and mRNA decay
MVCDFCGTNIIDKEDSIELNKGICYFLDENKQPIEDDIKLHMCKECARNKIYKPLNNSMLKK